MIELGTSSLSSVVGLVQYWRCELFFWLTDGLDLLLTDADIELNQYQTPGIGSNQFDCMALRVKVFPVT